MNNDKISQTNFKKKSKKFAPQKFFKGTTDEILNNPLAIKGNADAPIMGFLDDEMTKDVRVRDRMKGMGFHIGTMIRMFLEMRRSKKTISKNPKHPKTTVDPIFLQELKHYAGNLGVLIGFTKLRKELIFKDEAVLFDNTIVLSMEMDYDKMDKAPSKETQVMIIKTYNKLGIISNKITKFLRKHGYSAQACHPLGGPICYPPLIGDSGMGWYGRHGIAIIPEYGPRHRITAILTNIENLPQTTENKHKWIEGYCQNCGRCINKCPVRAINDHAIDNNNGTKTHINNDLCFKEFSTNYGCSVCVKVCMFNKLGYDRIKQIYEKKE